MRLEDTVTLQTRQLVSLVQLVALPASKVFLNVSFAELAILLTRPESHSVTCVLQDFTHLYQVLKFAIHALDVPFPLALLQLIALPAHLDMFQKLVM